MAVDKWISCGLFLAGGRERVEDAARQERAAGDEPGEDPARGRARVERAARGIGAVDAAGGDQLEAVAEALTDPAHVLQRGREEGRPREAAGPLGEPPLVHPPGVSGVGDLYARAEPGRARAVLLGLPEVRRDLHE